ncbi:MAG: hypothetical protein KDB65_09425 [Calditrichaeota bacterium]|nr:hypothetical protein [Calditrichota bacterium]MCB9369408.1 hypothetical protein [Calditrichota bacterium]
MSETLDLVLVILAVAASVAYLAWRKLRLARRAPRDWTSGHAEACDSCPIVEIQKARQRLQLSK